MLHSLHPLHIHGLFSPGKLQRWSEQTTHFSRSKPGEKLQEEHVPNIFWENLNIGNYRNIATFAAGKVNKRTVWL